MAIMDPEQRHHIHPDVDVGGGRRGRFFAAEIAESAKSTKSPVELPGGDEAFESAARARDPVREDRARCAAASRGPQPGAGDGYRGGEQAGTEGRWG